MASAGLTLLWKLAGAGKTRKALVHEVSHLSRRPAVVHAFVEQMEAAGVGLYRHAQGIETLMADGKRHPAAAIKLALLTEMARAERDTLRERINSGLAEARRKDVVLGRKVGSTMAPEAVLSAHKDVRKLKARQSIRNTAATVTGKAGSTVQRVKAIMA